MSTNLPAIAEQPTFDDLPVDQQLALAALAEGCNYTDSAERASVSRVTLWRWINSDPAFAAVYNAWKQELAESLRTQLLTAAPNASATILKAIEAGDAKLAFGLLRSLGVLNAPK